MSFFNRYQIQISILILLLGILWIGISSIFFESGTSSEIFTPQKGFLAPDFSVLSLHGSKYQLSDFQDQVVLIAFWASWCSPCKAEMPMMQKVYERFKDQGFTILAVNATAQDNITKVSDIVSDLSLTFPILLDTEGSITSSYLVKAFPTSFLIDRNGKINDIMIGGPLNEAYLSTKIETLLSEK